MSLEEFRPLLYFRSLRRIIINSVFLMLGRIYQCNLEFYLLRSTFIIIIIIIIIITNSIPLLTICPDFLFQSLVGCMFLGIYLYLLGWQICWCIVRPYDLLYFCSSNCNIPSFLSDFIYLSFFLFLSWWI